METRTRMFLRLFVQCSYPTYEEWKLRYTCHQSALLPCSYPTYEEWKLKYLASSSLKS